MENTYIEWDELIAQLPNHKDFRQFGADDDLFLDLNSIEPLRGSSERLISLFESALNENKKVIFSASSKGMIDRYASIFRDADLSVQIQYPFAAAPTSGHITLTASTFRNGFYDHNFLFITERDLTGSQTQAAKNYLQNEKRVLIHCNFEVVIMLFMSNTA